jgi:hypothetical protein
MAATIGVMDLKENVHRSFKELGTVPYMNTLVKPMP